MLIAGRLWTGGSVGRGRLKFAGIGSVVAGWPDACDRVVARAFGLGDLGRDHRMPDRAMVMWPRAVAGLWGWFFRIISAVSVG